jgi:hypothetical protein
MSIVSVTFRTSTVALLDRSTVAVATRGQSVRGLMRDDEGAVTLVTFRQGLSRQRAIFCEYLVAIQIKADRRHKKEPQAQYATWVGVRKFVAST